MLSFLEFVRMVSNQDDGREPAYSVRFDTVDADRAEVTLRGQGEMSHVEPVTIRVSNLTVDEPGILEAARFLMKVKEGDRAADLAAWAHTMRSGEVPQALQEQGFRILRSVDENADVILENGKERARVPVGSSLGRYNQVWREVIAGWEARQRLATPAAAAGASALSEVAMEAASESGELTDAALEELIGGLTEPVVLTAEQLARGAVRQLKGLYDDVVAALARDGVGAGRSSLPRSALERVCAEHGFTFAEVANPRGQEQEPTLFTMIKTSDPGDSLVLVGTLHAAGNGERIVAPFGVRALVADITTLIGEQSAALRDDVQAAAPEAEPVAGRVRLGAHRFVEQHAAELAEAPRVEAEPGSEATQGSPG